MANEHQRETAFLRQLLLYDKRDQRRNLEERMAQIQRDERCVRRVAWLMALLIVMAGTGFGYGEVLLDNFPRGQHQFVTSVICGLGLASVICLLSFAGLLMVYRKRFNELREECRRLVMQRLESCQGNPHITPGRDHPPVANEPEASLDRGWTF